MLRYGSTGSVTDTQEQSSKRYIRRLRLTLTDTSSGQDAARKVVNGTQRRKNGYAQQERSAGTEPSVQNTGVVTNGVRGKPRVFAVVQRVGVDSQEEVTACEWPVDHLRDEMKYIREVRESLEKVQEKMSSQLDGMQQSAQRLSQDMKVAYDQRQSLESEVRVRTTAMDSYDQMNSSLITSNIELQKSLLESCSSRVQNQEDLRSLRSSREQAEAKVMELEHQLATAHVENSNLKLQVESCQETTDRRMKLLTQRLHNQYEEQLEETKRRHLEEIEALQVQISEYVRRIEEAEENVRIAEAKIAERDERISEVERLLDCMGKEKTQLQLQLQDCERQLNSLKQADQVDAASVKMSKQLEGEATDLQERIKHLNDMVFSQQKKVKGMIKEIDALRAKVAQKDTDIADLLDRIAIVECENNELEDKLKYFMSQQKDPEAVSTRDIGVDCEPPLSSEVEPEAAAPVLSRPAGPSPVPPRRVESSALKYSQSSQYGSRLQSSTLQHSRVVTSRTQFSPGPHTLPRPYLPQPYSAQTSLGLSRPQPSPVYSYPRARTQPGSVYTPYMRLMEMSSNVKIV
ncbi:myocardial zonula adherens protein-like isoform X1 [Conger conger]|uniref:myocardial zonula adherens protein-like isoform X1 n=2 Tax=Conger conger TaxID=82655 RepID=UPI002A5AF9F3|nr:myocardial zonula adherens protein-like isoform X1 [Conger conger]